jgi:hypothetical protein
MIGSAFVDETGTGDEPRMLVGGIVAGALRWLGFSREWRQLLDRAEVPYAHHLEMDRNRGPFARERWWLDKKNAFSIAQMKILRNWCQLGLTVSLDKALFKEVYARDFPKGCSPDSAYGVACKELILMTQKHCTEYFADVEAINFVWESGHKNLGNVRQIFEDLKVCYGEKARNLGVFMDMAREQALPLQAIDQLVVFARQTEPEVKAQGRIGEVPPGALLHEVMERLPAGETFPVFYHELTEERLLWHRQNKMEMRSLRRRAKRQGG